VSLLQTENLFMNDESIGSQHIFMRTLNLCLFDMTTRRVELFYYPVFKGFKVPTNEELQWKIAIYFIHHPVLKPQKSEPWYRSKVSPGFNHEAVNCYLIVSPKPLKEPDRSHSTVRYSSIELYNFLKRGTLFMETAENLPKKFKLVWRDWLHQT